MLKLFTSSMRWPEKLLLRCLNWKWLLILLDALSIHSAATSLVIDRIFLMPTAFRRTPPVLVVLVVGCELIQFIIWASLSVTISRYCSIRELDVACLALPQLVLVMVFGESSWSINGRPGSDIAVLGSLLRVASIFRITMGDRQRLFVDKGYSCPHSSEMQVCL